MGTVLTDIDLHLTLRPPAVADGTELWRLAQGSAVLDVNSAYAYALWCRDFAATSIVAEVRSPASTDRATIAGFVTGFRRPSAPETLFVWQVAVDPEFRGHGVAAELLVRLVDRLRLSGVRRLEATVAPGNLASISLFRSVARRLGAECIHPAPGGFDRDDLPEGHDPEPLLVIREL